MAQLPQQWKGKTVIVAASGPSLAGLAPMILKRNCDGVPSIAVNTSFRLIENADVLFAGDLQWWKFHYKEIGTRGFRGALWTIDHAATRYPGVQRVKAVHRPGIGVEHIYSNGNSGMQAVNLAFLFGSRRVLLAGFDMKLGPEGEKHWHADHPHPMVQGQQFGEWIHKANFVAADAKRLGLEIINCTPGSALTMFPMSTLEKELA